MKVQMSMEEFLAELEQNHQEMLQYYCEDGICRVENNTCEVNLKDDIGIVLQLSNETIPIVRMELLKKILRDWRSYVEKALHFLKGYRIDLGADYFPCGIYVGEFSYGTYGFRIFDGFTISLKRGDGTDEDFLNLDVYTVQFKADGRPIGVVLWFE